MRVVRKDQARRELLDHAFYIAQDGSVAAHRFLDAAEAAFQQLAQLPRMGSPREFQNSRLVGIRQWPVPGFENYLIFYRPIEGGIEVLRVLHGARDIERLFQEEEP